MTDNDDANAILKLHLHYNGDFTRHPCSYKGGDHILITTIDWAGMNYRECCKFIERTTGVTVVKLYYCIPKKPLSIGIRFIEDDIDYAHFLDTAIEEDENLEISLYVDHIGDAIAVLWDDDMNLVVSEDESGHVSANATEVPEAQATAEVPLTGLAFISDQQKVIHALLV